jgi:hypothetical protein
MRQIPSTHPDTVIVPGAWKFKERKKDVMHYIAPRIIATVPAQDTILGSGKPLAISMDSLDNNNVDAQTPGAYEADE